MLSKISYNLAFHLNQELKISNELGMIIIIILFHLLKALNSFPLMNYSQALSTRLTNLKYFPMTLYS
jgi:hypothetical protein